MAASKRQMNWSGVAYTLLSGGSAVPATGVTQCSVDTGGNLLKFSGDGDRGPTLIVNDFNEPVIGVTTADLGWLMALVPGTPVSFTATHNDAKLATGGAVVYTLNPAVVEAPQNSGQHRQIGSGQVNFVGYFSDGTTNPLSFTRT